MIGGFGSVVDVGVRVGVLVPGNGGEWEGGGICNCDAMYLTHTHRGAHVLG